MLNNLFLLVIASAVSFKAPLMSVELNLNGLNLFLTANDSLCLMCRVDSVCLVSPNSSDIVLTFYKAVVDQVNYQNTTNTIYCCSVADLPEGCFGCFQKVSITKQDKVHLSLLCLLALFLMIF